jgi:hypothetical protein
VAVVKSGNGAIKDSEQTRRTTFASSKKERKKTRKNEKMKEIKTAAAAVVTSVVDFNVFHTRRGSMVVENSRKRVGGRDEE